MSAQLSALTNGAAAGVSFASPVPDTPTYKVQSPAQDRAAPESSGDFILLGGKPAPVRPSKIHTKSPPLSVTRRSEEGKNRRKLHLKFRGFKRNHNKFRGSLGTPNVTNSCHLQRKLKVFTKLHTGLENCLHFSFNMHKLS